MFIEIELKIATKLYKNKVFWKSSTDSDIQI